MKKLFLTKYLYGNKKGEYFNGIFCVIYSFIFALLLSLLLFFGIVFEVTGDKTIISFICIFLYLVHAFILACYDNMAINIISMCCTFISALVPNFYGYFLIILIIPICNFLIFIFSEKEGVVRLLQFVFAGMIAVGQICHVFVIVTIDIPTGYNIKQSIVSPDKTYVIKELITDRGFHDDKICIYKNKAIDLGFINIQSREGSYDIDDNDDINHYYYDVSSSDNDIEWIDNDTVAVNGYAHDVKIS